MVFSLAARSAAAGALRTAARPAAARPAVLPAAMTLGRRGYAEAVSDKLKLSFILPHAVRTMMGRLSAEIWKHMCLSEGSAECSDFDVVC